MRTPAVPLRLTDRCSYNPHMKRLVDQFTLFTLRMKFPADGPDCVEGGYRILKQKRTALQPMITLQPRKNTKRL